MSPRNPSAGGGRSSGGSGRGRGGAPSNRAPAPKRGAKPAGAKPAGAKGGSGPRPKPRSRSGTDTRAPAAPRVGGGVRSAPHPASSKNRGVGGEQVEGRHAVRELLLAGQRQVREILVSRDLDDAEIINDIVELADDAHVPIREVSRNRLDGQARTDAPQGVIARAESLREWDLDDLARPANGKVPFLLALDGVTDPGNLGALLRSAECAGVTGVVLPKHRSVHVTPAVTKAAAGAIEHLPIALVGGLPSGLGRLRDLGVWSVGLDMTGERTLWEVASLTEPVVLVLGAEGKGLSRLTRQRCDQVARIPLRGRLASLNVSVAGALACFEVTRARETAAPG